MVLGCGGVCVGGWFGMLGRGRWRVRDAAGCSEQSVVMGLFGLGCCVFVDGSRSDHGLWNDQEQQPPP